MADVIVIGGGVVGMSAAYHLAKAGASTLLIDRHHAGRATDAGAGILSPATGGVNLPNSWFEFGVACADYYPALIDHLRREQAQDTGYAVCGQLTVAVSDDEIEPYQHARQVVLERQARRGIPAKDDLDDVSSEEAQRLFPPLAPTQGAFYYRSGARVDGRMLTAALQNAAETYQLMQKNSVVDCLIIENGQITGVVVDGETLRAGKFIIAGGAWSAAFGEQLGVQIPVKPQRGQIIHLSLPGIDTSAWPVITSFHGHYMVAWDDSRVVVGATREPGAGFDPVTTVAGMQEVLGEGLRVAPGLSGAQFREIRVGLRPSTVDNLPVLGGVPGISNLFVATGHGASGLQLGPYSGKLAADWALNLPLETGISAFAITRFGA
ncbi:MAG TPA: FAD-dependent oxidoreductase, partial [Phototrophicaceae bacterium]|nr:FAD-dependent oxidoreductase [Phototrophicaceae bacterium]